MATGFYTWSKTPATNSTADTTINWAEGQSPSSVNDSSRAMMARLAEYRDDISGTLTTAGTSTAYTVATNQVFSALSDLNNRLLTFVPHTTSGASPTLAVDGLTAQPIRSATGTPVPSASLVAGTPYSVIYFSATTEFILVGFTADPYNVPIGAGMIYLGTTAPNSAFAMPYGQAISRTTYATLFGLPGVGTAHGVGDGSTTFNLPDIRDRTIAGWGSMGGSAASLLTNQSGGVEGDTVGAKGGAETDTLTTAKIPSHTHTATVTDPTHSHTSSFQVFNSVSAGGHAANGGGSPTATEAPTIVASGTGISVSNSNTGGGAAHNNVQPTIILPYIIRII